MVSSCMICETPYGILNCVNFAYHKNAEEAFDLYVGDNFKNSQKLAERLKESGLFAHVWTYRKEPEPMPFKEKVDRKYFPEKYLCFVVGDETWQLPAYEKVYLTSATRIPTCMILACKKAEVYYIEDGLRSYVDDIYVEPISMAEKMFHRIMGRNHQRVIPKVVYLNNVGICAEDAAYEVCSLPGLVPEDQTLVKLLYQIFDYSVSGQYADKKIIYLAQPMEKDLKLQGIDKIEQDIEWVLSFFGDCLLYRPHPRQGQVKDKAFPLDREGKMWELVCMNEISDETILIGSFSTALFTPKLLYDKEPWMIFTYPLYREYMGNKEEKLLEGIETMIACIRRTCRNPQKVICVEHLDEMENIIQKVIKEERSYEANSEKQ